MISILSTPAYAWCADVKPRTIEVRLSFSLVGVLDHPLKSLYSRLLRENGRVTVLCFLQCLFNYPVARKCYRKKLQWHSHFQRRNLSSTTTSPCLIHSFIHARRTHVQPKAISTPSNSCLASSNKYGPAGPAHLPIRLHGPHGQCPRTRRRQAGDDSRRPGYLRLHPIYRRARSWSTSAPALTN